MGGPEDGRSHPGAKGIEGHPPPLWQPSAGGETPRGSAESVFRKGPISRRRERFRTSERNSSRATPIRRDLDQPPALVVLARIQWEDLALQIRKGGRIALAPADSEAPYEKDGEQKNLRRPLIPPARGFEAQGPGRGRLSLDPAFPGGSKGTAGWWSENPGGRRRFSTGRLPTTWVLPGIPARNYMGRRKSLRENGFGRNALAFLRSALAYLRSIESVPSVQRAENVSVPSGKPAFFHNRQERRQQG
jgi:hypothetical protein